MDGEYTYVGALAAAGDALIAGGRFTAAGGVACNNIARWDGSVWHALGSGTSDTVSAVKWYRGELVVGGYFPTAGPYVSAYLARWECGPCVGDLNCDGQIDFGDINPFVAHLSDFDAWQTAFAGCSPGNGDINGDGTYGQWSFGDINSFVQLMMQCGAGCPCPVDCP